MPLREMFGDVKFVCMGGSAPRMERLAKELASALSIRLPTGMQLAPIGKTERYSLFKVGPIICVNHGMGCPSLSILMHEITKLLRHAQAENVIYIRIGTSGGLGVSPGTVVLTTEALNGLLEPYLEMAILGRRVRRETMIDSDLLSEIEKIGDQFPFAVEKGKTVGTDCFYEGQGRTDGAFHDYSEEDKMEFLRNAASRGVKNIEMEATYFAMFCKHTGIRGVIMCSVLVNRLLSDQIRSTSEELAYYSNTSSQLAIAFIKHHLAQESNPN